jgi:hypothetical protein
MPETPKDDPSLSELARAMASTPEPVVVVDDGSGGVVKPDKPKAASTERKDETKGEEKPEGDETPTSQETPEGKDGVKPDGEKEGDESPFKDVNPDNPEEAVKALLKIPKLGKVLQSWSDTAAVAQVQAALARERPSIEASATQKAEDTRWDEHFASMSQEDVAEEISKDQRAASAYARYQARQERGAEPDADGVAAASKVYAFTAQIALNNQLLKDSDLPAEAKAELDGKNFTKHGPDGILMWGEAIEAAVVEQKVEARVKVLLEERWEGFREEQLAKEDPERPPVVQGSRARPVPDLLAEDSASQMEKALAGKTKDKK